VVEIFAACSGGHASGLASAGGKSMRERMRYHRQRKQCLHSLVNNSRLKKQGRENIMSPMFLHHQAVF